MISEERDWFKGCDTKNKKIYSRLIQSDFKAIWNWNTDIWNEDKDIRNIEMFVRYWNIEKKKTFEIEIKIFEKNTAL